MTTQSLAPVPSITLAVTKSDISRVLDASKALAQSLRKLSESRESSADGRTAGLHNGSSGTPLKNNRTSRLGSQPAALPPTHVEESGAVPVKSEPAPSLTETMSTSEHPQPASKPPLPRSSVALPIKNEPTNATGTLSNMHSTVSVNDSTTNAEPRKAADKRPLHEMVLEAAVHAKHHFLNSFLDKMKHCGATVEEMRAAILLFHDMSMDAKFGVAFDAIDKVATSQPRTEVRTLSRQSCVSLLRSIVTGIHNCIENSEKRIEIEMGQHTSPSSSGLERPSKRLKMDDAMTKTTETTAASTIPALQSPTRSFDSSLATLKEEDDDRELFLTMRKEFDEIAAFAVDHLFRYADSKQPSSSTSQPGEPTEVSLHCFLSWTKSAAMEVVPWLELMELKNWDAPKPNIVRKTNKPTLTVQTNVSEPHSALKSEPTPTSASDPPSQSHLRKPAVEEEKKDATSEPAPPQSPSHRSVNHPQRGQSHPHPPKYSQSRPAPSKLPSGPSSHAHGHPYGHPHALSHAPSSSNPHIPVPSQSHGNPYPPQSQSHSRVRSHPHPLPHPHLPPQSHESSVPHPRSRGRPRSLLPPQGHPPPTVAAGGPTSAFFGHPPIPMPPAYTEAESRTVVSFDFTGSMPPRGNANAYCIRISEENLLTLRNLVRATDLQYRQTKEVCKTLISASFPRMYKCKEVKVMGIHPFRECLGRLISDATKGLSNLDLDIHYSCFIDFFSCFDRDRPDLHHGECDAHELAVGFSFLCAGNKSAKLSIGFDILKDPGATGLTTEQLEQYLRSYLTMLIGISLLASAPEKALRPKLTPTKRIELFSAVENGAKWTLRHYISGCSADKASHGPHTFEDFATWYTNGGFNVAPWLELLDLKKVLSLVGTEPRQPSPRSPARSSSIRGQTQENRGHLPPSSKHDHAVTSSHASEYRTPPQDRKQQQRQQQRQLPDAFALPSTQDPRTPPPAEVLFNFPLANQHTLIVLRDDATYVKDVVGQLGLIDKTPDMIWETLSALAGKNPPASKFTNSPTMKDVPVSKHAFLRIMEEIVPFRTNKSKGEIDASREKPVLNVKELMSNLYHSFDLHQIDQVGINELMGGLTFLCGGKKSTKLSFAFGVFDRRSKPKVRRAKNAMPAQHVHSLGGEDLFLFLRSFLIVMFSCCRQSWDLTDHMVSQYIADTANMVTDDVMRYQWSKRKADRIDFDEFGEWYNEGGFETAPWLELLDLRKWVLNKQPLAAAPAPSAPPSSAASDFPVLTPAGSFAELKKSPSFPLTPAKSPHRYGFCPPPPPDDAVDASFFTDDNMIMPMDSIDEMDMILMQGSHDKENDILGLNKIAKSFSYSPRPVMPPPSEPPAAAGYESKKGNALQFHLVTYDPNDGCIVSISQKRVAHLRRILVGTGLHKVDCETMTRHILSKAERSTTAGGIMQSSSVLTKDGFDSAMNGLLASHDTSSDVHSGLSELLDGIFAAFEDGNGGTANATEVACGFTVLCRGKKSDKLEYSFDLMDAKKRGRLSDEATSRYLWSFLTVLLHITLSDVLDSDPLEDTMTTMSGALCDSDARSVARIADAGSSWASKQAFAGRRSNSDDICFDEFAQWYTQVGFRNIPWLELLDLKKWALLE